VAARLAPAATGTDTGGSIRQPAGSAASPASSPPTAAPARYGMIAFASSLDQAGPMARSAEDCALLLSAMCGPDLDRDSTARRAGRRLHARLGDSLDGLRIGVPQEFFGDGLAPTCAPPSTRRWPSWRSWAPLVPSRLPRTELSIRCTTSSPRPRPAPTCRASTA
jgi:aspartyl-tRNA(Asn)/glutamyl-tRNA(Gln) amidotransferase subunit A